VGARRPSRRRRPKTESAAPALPGTPAVDPDEATAATTEDRGGYGKAALALALLLGTFVERLAGGLLPAAPLDVFHLVVAVAIAFLVARWYRGFMRRTLGRARSNRLERNRPKRNQSRD
jgi:uncharacterized membrane protein